MMESAFGLCAPGGAPEGLHRITAQFKRYVVHVGAIRLRRGRPHFAHDCC
jgi:hypothetical protein